MKVYQNQMIMSSEEDYYGEGLQGYSRAERQTACTDKKGKLVKP